MQEEEWQRRKSETPAELNEDELAWAKIAETSGSSGSSPGPPAKATLATTLADRVAATTDPAAVPRDLGSGGSVTAQPDPPQPPAPSLDAEAKLRLAARSKEHRRSHFPKNWFCRVCDICKNTAAPVTHKPGEKKERWTTRALQAAQIP